MSYTKEEIDERAGCPITHTAMRVGTPDKPKLLQIDLETGEFKLIHIKPKYYKLVFEVSPDLAITIGTKALGLLYKLSLTIVKNNITKTTIAEANKNKFMRYPVLNRRDLSKAKKILISNNLIEVFNKCILISPSVAWKGCWSLREEFINDEIHTVVAK